jgi:hypothetical protein
MPNCEDPPAKIAITSRAALSQKMAVGNGVAMNYQNQNTPCFRRWWAQTNPV